MGSSILTVFTISLNLCKKILWLEHYSFCLTDWKLSFKEIHSPTKGPLASKARIPGQDIFTVKLVLLLHLYFTSDILPQKKYGKT